MSNSRRPQDQNNKKPLAALVIARSDSAKRLCDQALMLVARSLETRYADSFSSARDELAATNFDLCICVEPLDELSAIELLQQSRRQGNESPFIAVLQNSGLAEDSQAMWTGAADVLELESVNVASLARAARHAVIRHHAQQQLRHEARADFLTGATNRRYFLELVERECNRCTRYQRQASLMVLDVDRLKSVNDRFGHQAGDELLQKISKICQSEIRDIDVFARYGGDEFAMLIPETSELDCSVIAHRIQTRVSNTELFFDGVAVTPGLSIGLANTADYSDPSKLIEAADQAMFEAKRSGRGRVVMAPQLQKPGLLKPSLLKLASSY